MKIKIYTMTHKKFDKPDINIYVPLQVGRAVSADLGYLGDDTGNNISAMNKYFGELTGLYWLWKNEKESDYIGICHYRRFFGTKKRNIMTEKDYAEIFEKYDVITSEKKQVSEAKNYYEQYAVSHYKEDLDIIGEIIKINYPDYYESFVQSMNGEDFYYGNLMVMPRNCFDEYCEWLFDILFKAADEICVEGRNSYEQRVFGFLSEQMLKIWLDKKQLRVYESDIIIGDEKAETKELKNAIQYLIKNRKVTEARNMFYEVQKVRPDVRLELSDIRNELPIIEQLLYVAEIEEKNRAVGLYAYSDDIREWMSLYRDLAKRLIQIKNNQEVEDNIKYIKSINDSETLVEVMLLNPLYENLVDFDKKIIWR